MSSFGRRGATSSGIVERSGNKGPTPASEAAQAPNQLAMPLADFICCFFCFFLFGEGEEEERG